MSDRNICTDKKRDGTPCGMINTKRVILDNGTVTYRCKHHRDGLTIAGSSDVGQPMPTTRFKTRADVERFIEWILQQGARGRIDAARINALRGAANSWIKARQRLEEESFAKLEEFMDWVHQQRQALREYALADEGTD
jgi:hypothetical protein